MSHRKMSYLAEKRLVKEYSKLVKEPVDFIIARPEEGNILKWHYVITGPPDTPFVGGQYHGTLTFPSNYPFAAPSIQMITPNGRYLTKLNICISMSNYHPEKWAPTWGPSSILVGFLSHMCDAKDGGIGCIIPFNDKQARELARESRLSNNRSKLFEENFPELYVENEAILQNQTVKNPVVNTNVKKEEPQQQQQPNEVIKLPDQEKKIEKAYPLRKPKRAKLKRFFRSLKSKIK